MSGGIGYWRTETSGVLRPAVASLLAGVDLSGEQIAALRAYFRQWMNGPWQGPGIAQLREDIDNLTTREAIMEWLDYADTCGVDPI